MHKLVWWCHAFPMSYKTKPDSLGTVLDVSGLTSGNHIHIGIEDGETGDTLAVWISPDEALKLAAEIVRVAGR